MPGQRAGRRPAGTPRGADPDAGGARSGWQIVFCGFGVLLLLAVCGLGTFFMLADERRGPGVTAAQVSATPAADDRRLESRDTDPAPLTAGEVFPGPTLRLDAEQGVYRVLRTQELRDCRAAVSGELTGLLVRSGCDQVVRGTLRPPDDRYLVTAGIFNLVDADQAHQAHQAIKPIVDGQRGRFPGMAAGRGTDALVLSSVQVAWHTRGHFLVYCVVARADGQPIAGDDGYAGKLLFDVVEGHLRGAVLQRRAESPPTPTTPLAVSVR